jgi:ribosomal protein S18 acetylase RimI-like enzyme
VPEGAAPLPREIVRQVAVDNAAVRLYSRLGFRVVRSDGAALTMLKTLDVRSPGASLEV